MPGWDDRAARGELWRRYDAGALGAKELEVRLKALDRAGTDPAAVEKAIDGPLPTSIGRRPIVAGLVGVLVLAAIGVPMLLGGDDGPGITRATGTTGAGEDITAPPLAVTTIPGGADCPELADAIAATEAGAALVTETVASDLLLSEPPVLPEGYTVDDDVDIVPGADPDIAMSVNAGTPLPVQIRARTFRGDLEVSMRTFRYESAQAAVDAGNSVIGQGVCTYGAAGFPVADHPELIGSMVSGPIPTTAFVGFRIADRRFTVSVQAASDADADVQAAQLLAGAVALAELESARVPPGP